MPIRSLPHAALRLGRPIVGWMVRRLGLLPAGTPDGLGEVPLTPDARIDGEVIAYFPDTLDAIYQVEHWYAALRALHGHRRVVIVVQDSRVAARVRSDSGLPVMTIVHSATLDTLLGRSAVRLALYVGHAPLNFQLLRFPSLAHVSLLHGDSDKTISVSNQTKAYDFAFVAGQAAIDRARGHLPLYDLSRLIPVGRPNLDAEDVERASGPDALGDRDGRPHRSMSVLYAPTWEGAQVTASYGTVASHGEAIVRGLLAGGFGVVYRPHPLTGVRVPEVGEADARIRRLISDASAADAGAGHRVDTGVPVTYSFEGADLLICDVSALSVEWLSTGRPLIITVPDGDQVVVASTALERVTPRLAIADIPRLADIVRREVEEDPHRAERAALVEYYRGDVTPGAAVQAFLDAVDHVIDLHRQEWARVQANATA